MLWCVCVDSWIRRLADCKWDVELYGKLLSVGGGKERMTAHFDGENIETTKRV